MKFTIITHVRHIKSKNEYFGYAPYIREMNIWLKHVNETIVVAPLINKKINPIHEKYQKSNLKFIKVPEFDITSLTNVIRTLFLFPIILYKVFWAMKRADHIHLRCPGNMGLIGAFVQILFPQKSKSAKYAGNWDPNAKQPFTYKLQRWILSNTFLTRNMQVLVYGNWPEQTKNIKPFFTATYSQKELQSTKYKVRSLNEGVINFLFVGTFSSGKQPLYAIQLVETLNKKGYKVKIDLYGEGKLSGVLQDYIVKNELKNFVYLKGNQSKETILNAYQNSNFLLLPSKSEGWPKVVAEAMFWGCVPIVTPVSCVPYMLGGGKRGILLKEHLEEDVLQLENVILKKDVLFQMSENAKVWSREFTTDSFEDEIKKILSK